MRVIAGLDRATPIMWHDCASLSGVAGTSPAMTAKSNDAATEHVYEPTDSVVHRLHIVL
jgi:hypothetical protein